MSYQSLKRVLGETSLERKCRFLFGGCLLILISGSFWWYGNQTEKAVLQQNSRMGPPIVTQYLMGLHWETMLVQKDIDPDLFINQSETLQNMEYTARSILPQRPDQFQAVPKQYQPRDQFEADLLAQFQAIEPPPEEERGLGEFRERYSDDNNLYLYYQPIRAEPSCLGNCHFPPETGAGFDSSNLASALGYSSATTPGELMAVVEIAIPNRTTQTAMNWNRVFLITTAMLTVFMAMVAAYVIVRYVIVKPLKHLRDVSEMVSQGNMSIRAEIHTGDEFEGLATSFNQMLQHLVTAHEELRHVNADLDAKVDELARANMQLYETNRIKSDFLATMSHELRTPLNSILGFSDVLGSIDSLDERQKRYVANIQKSGRLLLDMINSILDLAKIESGQAEVRLSDFSIEQIVSAQCDMARPLLEKKNIDLQVDMLPELPPMRQDQPRVQQVLNNLLSNAIKFTPEGGRITVSASQGVGDQLVLRVVDTGVGIAKDDLEMIFQKFRQGAGASPDNDAMTREHSGTGLGLSIVREICNLLGGDVSAESRLGKGSTFTVRLPWRLEEQPRLDSPVADGLNQFAKLRNDYSAKDRQPTEPAV
jgi:two-component system, NarL family, sensor histidine kinase BarA